MFGLIQISCVHFVCIVSWLMTDAKNLWIRFILRKLDDVDVDVKSLVHPVWIDTLCLLLPLFYILMHNIHNKYLSSGIV